MAGLLITDRCRVVAHMTLKLADGSVAETTLDRKPALITLGDDSISDVMAQKLMGLGVNQKVKFTLDAKDAFGDANPDLTYYLDVQQFPRELRLERGLIVAFEQPNGVEMPGMVTAIEGHSVQVDFNHPLAGKSIEFEIDILDILPHSSETE